MRKIWSRKAYLIYVESWQMNIFVVKSIAGRNELERLGGVPNWFIKPSNCSPIIGQVDDSIIGSFCLTRDNVRFDKYHAMMLFAGTKYLPDFTDITEISGRDIISAAIAETPINFVRDTSYFKKELVMYVNYKPIETKVSIVNGKLISGVLDKKSIGKGAIGGLYHTIAMDYGERKTLTTMYNMQQIAINYLQQYGFSIGIMDLLVSKESLVKIHAIESSLIDKSLMITEQLNRGEIIPPVGKTIEQFYEEQQIALLRVSDDFIEPIFESMDADVNNLFRLVLSGSKGELNHIFNISSAVGQIVINSERPPQKFSHGRTLPQYLRFDTTPEARGFVSSSYVSGMTASEFMYDAMRARFDLITKTMYTSVTGDSERKSVKNLEPLFINNNHMTMKYGAIVQLAYGDDGLDTRRLIKVKFPTIMISDDALIAGWKGDDAAEFEQIKADRDYYRKYSMLLEAGRISEPMSDEKFVSCDVQKYVSDELNLHGPGNFNKKMIQTVREFCDDLPYILLNDIQKKQRGKYCEYMDYVVKSLAILVRSILCSKQALAKLSPEMLLNILRRIEAKHQSALIQYGTNVGILSALSFSEPLTQYMLDAQHHSALGGTSQSAMGNVQEVFGARTQDRVISKMLLTMRADCTDPQIVARVANNIEVLKLLMFTKQSYIFYEKFGEPIHPQFIQEAQLISRFLELNKLLLPPRDLTRWCIRLSLSKFKMIYKNCSIEQFIASLRATYPLMYFVYTDENNISIPDIIIRIYIRSEYFKGAAEVDQIEIIRDEILNTTIRGIDRILEAKLFNLVGTEIKPDGSVGKLENPARIITIGSNIPDVLQMYAIDPLKVHSESIDEVQNILGIEAARSLLLSRIRNLGAGGLNSHHVSIYVDEMTFTGRVTSIERQGVTQRDINNVLLRCGFSGPLASFNDAAINNLSDPIRGITSPLMVGDIPKVGTAYNEFHVNEQFVATNTISADTYLDAL